VKEDQTMQKILKYIKIGLVLLIKELARLVSAMALTALIMFLIPGYLEYKSLNLMLIIFMMNITLLPIWGGFVSKCLTYLYYWLFAGDSDNDLLDLSEYEPQYFSFEEDGHKPKSLSNIEELYTKHANNRSGMNKEYNKGYISGITDTLKEMSLDYLEKDDNEGNAILNIRGIDNAYIIDMESEEGNKASSKESKNG